MAMLALISQNKNIKQHKVITTIGSEEKKVALEKFKMYQKDGIILNDFNDNAWILSDEKSFVTLDFTLDEVYVKKYMSYYFVDEFKDILKYYISFCMGQYIIGTIQEILNNTKKLLYNTECLAKIPTKRYLLNETGIQDFIELMPFTNEDIIFEEEIYRYEQVKRRELAEYQSYFLFGKLLADFWKNNINCKEKIFFYPVYLWWNISMILPVRVTEFTLIPKECLTFKDGNWNIKIRRTKMKSSKKK